MNAKHKMADGQQQVRARLRLTLLILLHAAVCCVSLVYISYYKFLVGFDPATFHIFYDPARLLIAVVVVAAFVSVSSLFVLARFSFGYFVGFYFYTVILGFLWINCFTDLNYDHRLAGLSAAASAAVFLVPALFIRSPIKQIYVLSARAFDRLLTFTLLLAVATIAVGAIYNFRLVGLNDIYDFRDDMEIPRVASYLITIVSNALLPFAFAGFVARNARWQAGAALLLLLLFYPITLSKLAFFTPFWLVAMLLLSKICEARISVILSLLVPMLAGVILLVLFEAEGGRFFFIVNFRLIAVPSVAIAVYNEFFATHDLTFFCQISVLKPFMYCPYPRELSVVMEKAYKLGNFNASLFATEGIASVGTLFAPAATFACGLVIALGNRLSAGLPPRFVILSGAILPLALLNVPLTTGLLTHGAAILFLLWYITPRTIFEPNDRTED